MNVGHQATTILVKKNLPNIMTETLLRNKAFDYEEVRVASLACFYIQRYRIHTEIENFLLL